MLWAIASPLHKVFHYLGWLASAFLHCAYALSKKVLNSKEYVTIL
jgi:hypothetical protein